MNKRGQAALSNRSSLPLAEIQTRLQAAILNNDESIIDALLDNSRTTRHTLFGVYRHAYVGRLVDILKDDYPFLSRHVGEEAFGTLARAYITAHPSRTQNARWFGAAFPAFVAAREEGALHPERAELAAIEKAVSDAFDSADAPSLSLGDLSSVAPDDWARLTFVAHPSTTLLSLATNSFEMWKALKEGDATPEPMQLTTEQHVVVWRQGTAPMARIFAAEEAMMWAEAGRGVRFAVLCEMLAAFDDPDAAALRAAGYLQGWLAAEMLTTATLA